MLINLRQFETSVPKQPMHQSHVNVEFCGNVMGSRGFQQSGRDPLITFWSAYLEKRNKHVNNTTNIKVMIIFIHTKYQSRVKKIEFLNFKSVHK